MSTSYTPRHARSARASAAQTDRAQTGPAQTARASSSAVKPATSPTPGGALDPAPAPSILPVSYTHLTPPTTPYV